MTEDPNRKSLRQFQCRDYLWETFEQMSRDLECSVDYLINEAMRHYARAQGRIRQTTAPPGTRNPAMASMGPAPVPQGPRPTLGNPNVPPVMVPTQRPIGGGASPPMGNPAMRGQVPPMPQQGYPQGRPPVAPQGGQGYPRMPQPAQGYPQQPPMVRPAPQAPPVIGAPPPGAILYAVYDGQRYPITKDEFFIGRSNKTSDLVVKDPNVSRRHARIVRHQGLFWMMDLGSTNGIEFQGGKIDRRPIGEGDVYRICDHEIAFTYQ